MQTPCADQFKQPRGELRGLRQGRLVLQIELQQLQLTRNDVQDVQERVEVQLS